MKAVLMTFALIWGGSLLAIALGIVGMWISARLRKRGSAVPEWKRPAEQRRDAAEQIPPLEPDPTLLVPWSAVRASKRRLGVHGSALHAEDVPA